jgi:hypothetical protein
MPALVEMSADIFLFEYTFVKNKKKHGILNKYRVFLEKVSQSDTMHIPEGCSKTTRNSG